MDVIGLSATILSRRRAYYDALEATNKRNEITDWLEWFAGVSLEAQSWTIGFVEFTIEKARLLDRLDGVLNARQRKALVRVLAEGPKGFTGGLSAEKYRAITGASSATATRDLSEMVRRGVLVRAGELRYARHYAPIPMSPGHGQ